MRGLYYPDKFGQQFLLIRNHEMNLTILIRQYVPRMRRLDKNT